MEPVTPQDTLLRSTITERLNAHAPDGVMAHGAPGNEYDPEMEDFAALMAHGETIDLQALQNSFA